MRLDDKYYVDRPQGESATEQTEKTIDCTAWPLVAISGINNPHVIDAEGAIHATGRLMAATAVSPIPMRGLAGNTSTTPEAPQKSPRNPWSHGCAGLSPYPPAPREHVLGGSDGDATTAMLKDQFSGGRLRVRILTPSLVDRCRVAASVPAAPARWYILHRAERQRGAPSGPSPSIRIANPIPLGSETLVRTVNSTPEDWSMACPYRLARTIFSCRRRTPTRIHATWKTFPSVRAGWALS